MAKPDLTEFAIITENKLFFLQKLIAKSKVLTLGRLLLLSTEIVEI